MAQRAGQADNPAAEPAFDGQAALPDRERATWIDGIQNTAIDDVEQRCAGQPADHRPVGERLHLIDIKALARRLAQSQPAAGDDGQDNDEAVPAQGKGTDLRDDRAHADDDALQTEAPIRGTAGRELAPFHSIRAYGTTVHSTSEDKTKREERGSGDRRALRIGASWRQQPSNQRLVLGKSDLAADVAILQHGRQHVLALLAGDRSSTMFFFLMKAACTSSRKARTLRSASLAR